MRARDLMTINYFCPVCGFDGLSEPPVNHAICPSCGTEFDYDDISVSHAQLRDFWLGQGAPWFSTAAAPPDNWNPIRQLIRSGLRPDFLEALKPANSTSAQAMSY